MTSSTRISLLSFLALGGMAAGARACSLCGCSLSSDWAAQGYTSMPGINYDVRAEFSDQDDLRTGLHSADRSAYPLPNDQELQQDTTNRALWLTLDDALSPHWALSLQVPTFDRSHTTIAPGDTGISGWHAEGLGDAILTARYQRFTPASSWSLQAGLKLPTGRFDGDFDTGPEAGTLVDRGLQLGTGTTDLIVGASRFWRPVPSVGCFLQASVHQPLAERDQFLPSTTFQVSAGARWLNTSSVTPELQVNARWEGREHGAEADTPDSGSTTLYASPGLSVSLSQHWTGYGFVQIPFYQRVNGLQLEPHWVLALGIRYRH